MKCGLRDPLRARRFGDDDGMAGGGAQARVEADLPGMVHEPSGAGAHILFMLRLGGDAGKAEIIAQLGHEAGLVAFQIIEHGLHGAQLIRERRVCQNKTHGQFHRRLDKRGRWLQPWAENMNMKPSELFGVVVRATGFLVILYSLWNMWAGCDNIVENILPVNEGSDGGSAFDFFLLCVWDPGAVLGAVCFFLADWIVKLAYRRLG